MPRFWSGYASWVSYAGSMAARQLTQWLGDGGFVIRLIDGSLAGWRSSPAALIRSPITWSSRTRLHPIRRQGLTGPRELRSTKRTLESLQAPLSSIRDWGITSRGWAASWPSSGPRPCVARIRSIDPCAISSRQTSGGAAGRSRRSPTTARRSSVRSPSAAWSPTSCSDLGIVPDAAIGYSMGESAALVGAAGLDRPRRADGSVAILPAVRDGAGRTLRRGAAGLGHPARSIVWTGSPGSCRVRRKTPPFGDRRQWVGSSLRADPEHPRRDGHRRRADRRPACRRGRCDARSSSCRPSAPCTARSAGSSKQDYRALHDIETVAPPGIAFYSGVSGRRYAGRSPFRRRGDRGAGLAADRLPRDDRDRLCRRHRPVHRGRPGCFVHPADRPYPRRSAARWPARPAGPTATRSPRCSRSWRRASSTACRSTWPSSTATMKVDSRPSRSDRRRRSGSMSASAEFRVPPLPSRPRPPATTMAANMNHELRESRIDILGLASRDSGRRLSR